MNAKNIDNSINLWYPRLVRDESQVARSFDRVTYHIDIERQEEPGSDVEI